MCTGCSRSNGSHRRGFSLAWLLISIAIFAGIATLTVSGLSTASRTAEVRLAAETLAAAIRDTRERSRSQLQEPICAGDFYNTERCPKAGCRKGTTCVSSVPLGGYGVQMFSVDEKRVYIFADTNNDGSTTYVPAVVPDPTETIEFISLSPRTNVTLASFEIDGVVQDTTTMGVTFVPDAGTAEFNNSDAGRQLKINLRWGENDPIRFVQVDRLTGVVEVLK